MTKVLIVDDSPEIRKLIRQVASESCDEVFECEDGDEVIAAFECHQPDWVLMDLEMKRVDGLKATASLMQLHPEAKVIIVTNFQDNMTRLAAAEAGARYFVGKDELLTLRFLIQ